MLVEFMVDYFSTTSKTIEQRRVTIVPFCAVNDQKANEPLFKLTGCNSNFGCLCCIIHTPRPEKIEEAGAISVQQSTADIGSKRKRKKKSNQEEEQEETGKKPKETSNSFSSTKIVDGTTTFVEHGARSMQDYLKAMRSLYGDNNAESKKKEPKKDESKKGKSAREKSEKEELEKARAGFRCPTSLQYLYLDY